MGARGVPARGELHRALRAGLGEQAEQRAAVLVRLLHQRGHVAQVVLERLLARAVAAALDDEDQQDQDDERSAGREAAPHEQRLAVGAGPARRRTPRPGPASWSLFGFVEE